MDLNQTNEPRFTDEEMAEVDRLQSDPSSEYYYNDPDESFLDKVRRKLEPYGEDFKGFIEYLFTPSRHFGTGQYSEGGLEAQMSTSGLDAEGRRRRTDSSGKYKQRVEEGQEDIAKAASFLVPFYDSGVNISNVVQEYMKPEQERDYEYIKSQFTEAGQSAAIEAGLLLMGGVVTKYGGKGIKALADKVKQYEIDPNAMSAFGVGAIKKKTSLTPDDFGYKEDNPVTKGFGGSEDWLSGKIEQANKSKNLLDGATTAFLGTNKDKPLFLNTDFISSLKGARGEVRKKGEPQYDRLKKTVDKEGFDPNKTILIEVNHKGEAYIIEGNTRAALAKELGVPNIKAEIRYKNGAELVDSPFSPQNILEKASTGSYQDALALSKKIDFDLEMAALDKAEDAVTWQKNAKAIVKKRGLKLDDKKSPEARELQESTRLLLENKITRDQHLETVDRLKPVRGYDQLPREPSDKALVFALDKGKREDGLFVLDKGTASKLGVKTSSLKVGDQFNSRLDIPAYLSHDTWIVTGTSPAVKTADGKSVSSYAKAVYFGGDGKPVRFIASQKRSEKIGTGVENKIGYATVSGTVKDLDADAIRNKAAELLTDPEWTQVGFDPRRQGGFYVRAGKNKHVPVREASEVIQIGPLVLAKNAKLDMDYEGYNEGGVAMNEQMEMAFMQQGGIKDDGMTKDPVSGNPIPPGSMASEVRDDIPAMLSEGEYVVPADVLRFYGVNFFEDLRNKAKSGLQNMEKNGRIGGEPLSPQQVQQNMGQSGVTMQANQGGAVGYQGGGGAIPDVYMDQAKALNPNPIDLSQYGVVGGSTFSSNPQAEANSITRTEIYVNAETGDTRSVNFVSSGTETKIVPPSDEQYTRPPYYLQGSSALKKAQQGFQQSQTGGGSDPKDPPETKPKQPFGQGVNWLDPKAYADSLLEGPDGIPKSIQMLSALAGPFGMAVVGGANAAMTLGKISDLRATQILATAQGDTATAEYIQGELDALVKRSPNIVSFLEESMAPGTSKAKEVLDRLGLGYEEDKSGNIKFSEKMLLRNKEILKKRFDPATIQKDEETVMSQTGSSSSGGSGSLITGGPKPGEVDLEKQIDEEVKEYQESGKEFDMNDPSTWVGGNKGGLMTKAKKKK